MDDVAWNHVLSQHVEMSEYLEEIYLRRGEQREAAETFSTPEGHAVRIDKNREVIGITIVNAKWLVERDGKITLTVPSLIETNPEDLAAALAAA